MRSAAKRRVVPLLVLAGVAVGLAVGTFLAATATQAQPPTCTTVRTRRNVATLSAAQIAALRRGIRVMQGRPVTDPRSWIYQANIHGTFTTPTRTAWNSCQHGSFFFLSWHRMYLYYFERILRQASSDPNLTLPYWNYSVPFQRALPLPYRQPANSTTNPLFVAQRNPPANQGALLPASATSFAAAFAFANFDSPTGSGLSFGGQRLGGPSHGASPHGALEQTPHDVVHGLVGGSNGWMISFEMAARDPIFWAHHANVDRLWNRWIQQGGGRQNPTGNSVWMTTRFTFFDENGQQVQLSGSQVMRTAQQLCYRYDDDPPILSVASPLAAAAVAPLAARPERRTVVGTREEPLELGVQPVRMTMPIPAASRETMAEAFAEVPQVAMALNVEQITVEKNPGIYYEMYVNVPEGQKPDPQSIHYVGNLAFFGLDHHAAGQAHTGGQQSYDVTGVVRELREQGRWSDEKVSMTFVPRGLISPSGKELLPASVPKVRIGRMSVTLE